jgi:hypothetical protein
MARTAVPAAAEETTSGGHRTELRQQPRVRLFASACAHRGRLSPPDNATIAAQRHGHFETGHDQSVQLILPRRQSQRKASKAGCHGRPIRSLVAGPDNAALCLRHLNLGDVKAVVCVGHGRERCSKESSLNGIRERFRDSRGCGRITDGYDRYRAWFHHGCSNRRLH